jgi:hypothetical protein
MSMRSVTKYLLTIMAACFIMAFGKRALAMEVDISDLQKLISSNEDMRVDSRDLAFFLNTHNYEVVPRDGDVEANLVGKTCKLDPNGDKSERCDISLN